MKETLKREGLKLYLAADLILAFPFLLLFTLVSPTRYVKMLGNGTYKAANLIAKAHGIPPEEIGLPQ